MVILVTTNNVTYEFELYDLFCYFVLKFCHNIICRFSIIDPIDNQFIYVPFIVALIHSQSFLASLCNFVQRGT